MASLDVDSLFTSIPLEETIDLCTEKLFTDRDVVCNLTRNDFKELLTLATNKSLFLFDNDYYHQKDGVAMGSPLGPTLANAFLCYYEEQWLRDCPVEFAPLYYKRYVDDIFVLFRSPDHVVHFQNYMNSKHASMSFTSECENDGVMPFLDITISKENGAFTTSVYHKPTFTGLYTHADSCIPYSYKMGLILTLIHRYYMICSTYSSLHIELGYLKIVLLKNRYPLHLIDKCIRLFFDKIFGDRTVRLTAEKKTLSIVLPFLGSKRSSEVKKHLSNMVNKSISACKLRVIFRSPKKISNMLPFKDKIPDFLQSHLVYKFKCGCNSTYHGLCERHTWVRWSDHLSMSWRTGKKIVGVQSEIKEHLKDCNSTVDYKNFEIITKEENSFLLRVKESLLIKHHASPLNKNTYSTPLRLF